MAAGARVRPSIQRTLGELLPKIDEEKPLKSGFRWCPHCGKPHSLEEQTCSVTGQPLDAVIHQRPTPPALRSPFIGAILDGKYRILRPIGGGGMGMVFEAEHIALKRLVAVKVVGGAGAGTADALARLAREAHLVAAIHHPNICDVYDVGELPNGGPYIVLERLVGDTLASRMHGVKMRCEAVVDIFVQILSGLAAAHRLHILHRDLKPQNIFLVEHVGCAPLVKVLDFGLARDLSAPTKDRLTKPGRMCGTVQYMSPEQLRAEQLDARSDLFAVGVMLYETLTGRHPFAAASRIELQTNILRSMARPLRTYRPDAPRRLEEMIAWAMSPRPAERPSSALELQRGLLSALPPSMRETPVEEEPASVTNPIWIPPSSSPAA
jgi:eukaryotic-like serine/threonine-protein kinase